jgi:hypothetical protein
MKKEMLKSALIRAVVLLPIFIITVAISGIYINNGDIITTQEMKKAVFPIIYMKEKDKNINPLYGYSGEMQVNTMRDTITPLSLERTLPIEIQTYGNEVKDISYEIITSDGKYVVEEKKIVTFESTEQTISATLEIENNMRMNQEYVLRILLGVNGKTVSYYTRIIQQDKLNADKYVDFLESFYSLCLSKESGEQLEVYLDTNSTSDNTSLQHVTIHATPEQLMWGGAKGLEVQVSRKPTPILKEINATTASGVIEYEIVANEEDGSKERYSVTEFYRMRYDENRVKLLDFDRRVEKIFEPTENFLTDKGIYMGIVDTAPLYKENEEGTMVAFVQNGQLWCYDNKGQKITKVFGFEEQENSDIRYSNKQHSIKILRVDEEKGIDFLIYGYMNRGEHEGSVGVGVYHMENENNDIEEKAFIQTNQAFEWLNKDMGQLSYVTEEGLLYLMVAQSVYQINLETKELETIVEDLSNECYASSDSGGFFAWTKENNPLSSKTISVMNLDTKEVYEITAPEDSYIRPLGFIEEDIVYGFAKTADVAQTERASVAFPMYNVIISSTEGEIYKDYKPVDFYVKQVELSAGLATLKQVKYVDGMYQDGLDEHIINNAEKEKAKVTVDKIVTEKKQTEVVLTLPGVVKNRQPKVFHAKILSLLENNQIDLPKRETENTLFYIYSLGHLNSIEENVGDAIQKADEQVGVVVNENMQYIWERGNLKTRISLDVDAIPEIIKKGTTDIAALEGEIDGTILDLTGCTLKQVLYFVSKGIPVSISTAEEGTLVIAGYDEYNTIVYDPSTGETRYKGINDSTELFEKNGNKFVSYLETLKK